MTSYVVRRAGSLPPAIECRNVFSRVCLSLIALAESSFLILLPLCHPVFTIMDDKAEAELKIALAKYY